MPDVPAAKPSSRVSAVLDKIQARRRLIFIIDATGSREQAWDMASKLQAQMFHEAAKIGTLDVQLVYFRGVDGFDAECKLATVG